MRLFDVLGPVMTGPSSSHTAGAVRIGLTARNLLGEAPKTAEILLHGSFAATGRGHGTDRALVAGLLGMICDGAKETCSLKVATAGCEAYGAARLAVRGGGVRDVQGMVAPGIAELGEILAEFSRDVLAPADGEMARIMLRHQTPA